MRSSRLLGAVEILFGGERLQLLASHAVWWPSTETVLIADTHFGKDATFRASAIPIPDTTMTDLRRLDEIIESTRCRTLIILGDLLHNRRGLTAELIMQWQAWRSRHADLKIVLVRGNHDRAAGDPPPEWNIEVHPEPLVSGPFRLLHNPALESDRPSLAGHLHPKHRFQFENEHVDLHCFIKTKRLLILPAFGSFIDGRVLHLEASQVFAVAGEEVVEAR
ncbi:ligase-associated DNA damage response endonuclease PdeM [Thalassoroseus pseudoceratinae]|uniref:ligase-associated DNA damage response endonuclease PdeM n=1 Tax=Thalassoroseus pseudoceratinae TaxID=2713176 RepID=UPI001423940B|nr:ligase-associated DNA damage response endonuclease PdeM [Thalassoroseus pseudoceratinae]